jgi:phosphoglycolate phosphatase
MRAIVFDVDGVLLDSLAPHVKFCHDMNERFNLGLKLPSLENGKEIAATPMDNFLRRAGFPEKMIPKLLEIYAKEFPTYKVLPFKGAGAVLRLLKRKGFLLCISTANYKANVARALGKSMSEFSAVYDVENSKSKVEAVNSFCTQFGLQKQNVLFVGDSLKDQQSAQKAGVKFIGITHGWEITKKAPFPTVSNLRELAWKVAKSLPQEGKSINVRRFSRKQVLARRKRYK